MGKRKKKMVQRARHRGPSDGTHEDKYAASAPRRGRSQPSPQDCTKRKPVKPAQVLTPEAQVTEAVRQRDAESEQNLRSLPGGTVAERLLSAERGLFQDQDAIQSTFTPPKAR